MLTHVLAPLPLLTGASVLCQPKQNHSICYFQGVNTAFTKKSHFLVGGLRTHRLPLCLSGIHVWKKELPVYISKKSGGSDSKCCRSLLLWPQRNLLCCGPGGCRVLTSKNPEGSWAARRQATKSSRSCRSLDTARLIRKHMELWHPWDADLVHPCIWGQPSAFHAEDKAHPRREESLSMEGKQSHVTLCLCKKINQALHFSSAASFSLIAF